MSVLARAQITIIVINDGPTGPTGKRMLTGMVHYQLSNASAPAKPSATDFNFATRIFSGLTANWAIDSPVYASGNANKYWYCTYTVEESTSGSGTGTPVFGAVKQAIGFSGLVTFTGDQSVSDGTKTLSFGAAGTTKIDGGNIDTGTVSADRIDVDNLVVKQAVIGKIQDVAGPLASTAKSEAISAAASDATTKANAAQAAAEAAAAALDDAIQVGGRNLLLNSATFAGWAFAGFAYANNEITANFNGSDNYTYCPNIPSAVGKLVTVSFKAKVSGASSVDFIFGANAYTAVTWFYKWLTSEFAVISYTFTYQSPFIIGTLVRNNIPGAKIHIKDVKVELGNKATDWTPAPEDVDADIDAAQSAAESYALAKANLAETTAKAYADGVVSDEEARAIADATAKANAAQAAAEAAAAALDDAIQVGGRNLLKDTKAEVRTTNYLMKNYYLGDVKPQEGEQVTIMFRGALGTGKEYFGPHNSGGSIPLVAINNTDKGADGIYRKTFNWKISTASNTYVSFYHMFSSVTAESWVAEVMLVIGNKVAYYSEAPEDVQAEIDAAQTAAVTTAASDATSKMNAAKDALAQEAGYTNFADMASKAALTVNGLLNSQIINTDDLFANTAFISKLVAFSAFIENLTVRKLLTPVGGDNAYIEIKEPTTVDPYARITITGANASVWSTFAKMFVESDAVSGLESPSATFEINTVWGTANRRIARVAMDGFASIVQWGINNPGVKGGLRGLYNNRGAVVEYCPAGGEYAIKIKLTYNTAASTIDFILDGLPTANPGGSVTVWKDSKGFLRIGAAVAYTAADVGAVPTSRTVNNKALSADISLTAADVGAAAESHTHAYVPTSRTVNSKALSADITLSAADVGALATNTIQYFTQAQWNALTQAQKDAVPLALVEE